MTRKQIDIGPAWEHAWNSVLMDTDRGPLVLESVWRKFLVLDQVPAMAPVADLKRSVRHRLRLAVRRLVWEQVNDEA